MADLKSIGKAIGRVATNYLEAQSNHVKEEEKTKYDTLASNLDKLRESHFSDNKR